MILFQYNDQNLSVTHTLDSDPFNVKPGVHIHGGYELYCFVSGDVRYMIEGREFDLDYGTTLLVRPGELHTAIINPKKAYERYVLNFNSSALPEEFRESLLSPFKNRPLGELNVYRASDFPGITPRDLIAAMCTRSENEKLHVHTLLPAVLTLLQSAVREKSRTSDSRSVGVQMVDFVNTHLCDPVTVSMVAEEFYMSVSQVTRIFKATTGTTVGQYCLAKRLLKARRKISGGASAIQASRDCGFGCYSSFFRLYKKQFGCPPSEKGSPEILKKEYDNDSI